MPESCSGKEHYQYREVYQEKTFPEIPVENGVPLSGNLGDPVVVHADLNLKDEEKSLKLLMAEDEEVTVSEELPDRLKAPLKKGQTVGTVTYRCLSHRGCGENHLPVVYRPCDPALPVTIFICK